MIFVEGQSYTRQEINAQLGGEVQHYLPTSDGRIVCGCFNSKLNPEAPEIILAGNGPVIMKKAGMLCEQGGSIPVFMKRAVNGWEYVGFYKLTDWTESAEVIAHHSRQTRRDDISRVLYLKPVI